MIRLTINGKPVEADDGATILDAAKSAGIDIPTMCHRDKNISPVSCFVCVVKVDGRENFVPSCATAVRDGMAVDACSDEVRECRRRALELMLSEHAGDCEAPCAGICPCGLDIPEVMRRILSGNIDTAMEIIRRHMPFPAVLGHICPAPCQKGCRRAAVDGSVEIRAIHKIIAEKFINAPLRNKNADSSLKSKHVAVIGSGPAGLSAAYFLAVKGYSCTVFESQPKIGGTLRCQFDESTLPAKILDAEIEHIANLGVKFTVNRKISAIDEIYNDYDAIIIAVGLLDKNQQEQFPELERDGHGIKTCHDTFAASDPKVFACGSAVRPVRMAARSAGQGKLAAASVDNRLSGKTARKQFSMNTGKLSAAEAASLAELIPYTDARESSTKPLSAAARCLQCDCGRKNSCALRDYAAQYGARHLRYATGNRKEYARRKYDSGLVHEPGKCTACGRCVNITKERNITPGLSFAGRGSGVHIAAPFGTPIDRAMGEAIDECVKSCPTGALWMA